jgi:UDP-perosamine 4-acetyltransferase
MEKVIVIGTGGHARVVIDIIEEMGNFQIAGLIAKDKNIKDFAGYPVIGTDEDLRSIFTSGIKNAAIGIGGFRDNHKRTEVFLKLKSIGFKIINAIHPGTIISRKNKIGEGCTICPGVIINTDVKIGDNVIIITGAVVDHETVIHDNVLIATGVTVGAYCTIGKGTLCALGSKIISGVNIGENVLIAAGAVVTNDVKKGSIVYGIPAKSK